MAKGIIINCKVIVAYVKISVHIIAENIFGGFAFNSIKSKMVWLRLESITDKAKWALSGRKLVSSWPNNADIANWLKIIMGDLFVIVLVPDSVSITLKLVNVFRENN